jgi:hypothetical protein
MRKFLIQIIERKAELAKLEVLDCGKPYDEAAWDMVYDTPYRSVQFFQLEVLICLMFLLSG